MKTLNPVTYWLYFFLLLSSLFLSSFFHPGEVRGAEFKLIPSLALQGEYNDNIFFTSKNKVDDYIATVTPGLELIDRTENLDLNLLGRVPILRYLDNTELNHVDQNYRGRVRYSLTPNWGVSGEAGYLEDSRPDRDILVTGLVVRPTIRRRQNYGAGIDHTFAEKTKAILTYAYYQDDYSSLRFADLKAHDANLGFTQDLSRFLPNVLGRMNFNYSRYEYNNASVDYYYATIGMSWSLEEKWKIVVDGGGSYTTSYVGPDQNKKWDEGTGWVGMASLVHKGEKTDADLTISYRKMPAYGYVGVTDRTSVSIGISHRFTYELYGYLSAGYFLNKATRGQFSVQAFDQDTLYIIPRVRYEFNRDVALEASYNFTYLVDKIADAYYPRNLFMLRLYFQHAILE
jgi:hypothetical protein